MFFGFGEKDKLVKGVKNIQRGIEHLKHHRYESAVSEFQKAAATRNDRLVRGVAGFYLYNTERVRKEERKLAEGNARPMAFPRSFNRDAWSDVDIAAVLVAAYDPTATEMLSRFLGRSPEAIRFQKRYVYSLPLESWVGEKGDRYTRFTQTRKVAESLGLL